MVQNLTIYEQQALNIGVNFRCYNQSLNENFPCNAEAITASSLGIGAGVLGLLMVAFLLLRVRKAILCSRWCVTIIIVSAWLSVAFGVRWFEAIDSNLDGLSDDYYSINLAVRCF